VFLTHYIPLYQVQVLRRIASSVRDFHVLLSTPIEPNRDFTPDWSGLDVTVQNTCTFRRRWRHPTAGFDDSLYVHVPLDTTRRLRSLNPDVVMSLELGARSAGAAIYCKRNPSSKLILCTYMSEWTEQGRGWIQRQLRKRLVRRADALTYNGPSCRRYLKRLGVPEQRLFHLPYAADDRTTYQGPVERDDASTRHRLMVIGQLSDRKGVLPMLRQISEYCRQQPNRNIELLLAGDGPLRGLIESYELPANLDVIVLGNIRSQDLGFWMGRCGALIAPTLADEWMLAVNEALQAGLPVLGSIHAQAVTSLIQSGVNGWQFDPTVAGSLASSLDRYFDQSVDALASMRIHARQSVAARTPSWAASGAIDAIAHVLGVEDRRQHGLERNHG
jgi:glycosyltransferase involved in cell wall biosynthesis